jgi:hypothetical protein
MVWDSITAALQCLRSKVLLGGALSLTLEFYHFDRKKISQYHFEAKCNAMDRLVCSCPPWQVSAL